MTESSEQKKGIYYYFLTYKVLLFLLSIISFVGCASSPLKKDDFTILDGHKEYPLNVAVITSNIKGYGLTYLNSGDRQMHWKDFSHLLQANRYQAGITKSSMGFLPIISFKD